MIPIQLLDTEIRIAKWLGKYRQSVIKEAGYRRELGNRGDMLEAEQRGIIGEMAFHKLLNLYYVPDQSANQAGTPDLTINGQTVQIKTTRQDHHGLMCNVRSRNNYDIWVLMYFDPNTNIVTYKGWLYREDFIQKNRIINPTPLVEEDGTTKPRTPFYAATQGELYQSKFWESKIKYEVVKIEDLFDE